MLIWLFMCHLLLLVEWDSPPPSIFLPMTYRKIPSVILYPHISRDLFYYSITFHSVLQLIRSRHHKLKEGPRNRVRIYTCLCLTILHSYMSQEHSSRVHTTGDWFPQSPTQGRRALGRCKKEVTPLLSPSSPKTDCWPNPQTLTLPYESTKTSKTSTFPKLTFQKKRHRISKI